MAEQEREGSEPLETATPAAAPAEAPAAPPAEAPAAPAAEAPAAAGAPSAPSDNVQMLPPERPRTVESEGPERREPGERRRRPFGRRKVCTFCVEKVKDIDYKDALRLRRYVSDRGRIESRRKTGTCAKHQRWLATALKRARHLALLPYTPEHVRNLGGPVGRR